ncbi:MAG TPA: ATP-binding protein [Solirubrobacteraceae bacterium]
MAKLGAIPPVRRDRRRADPTRPGDSAFSGLFVRFALTGLVAMLLIGVVGFVLIRHSATASAIRQAKERAALAGRGIVEPLLTPRLLAGDKAALTHLDGTVRHRILRDTPIVRVKIWDAYGRIVYSDATPIIGARFPLGVSELDVLRRGGIAAHASDLTRAENRSERGFRKLVEVYVGVRASDGRRLLYEDYERSSTISASSQRQWEGLLPALGGALAVLYLIQLPLAYSLARRLRRRQQEREELLRRAIDASDLERRRIAADLHDGAVQRLAGVSLSLAAAASGNGKSERDQEPRLQAAVSEAAAETRETIRELRTLLVDIYPPTLQRSGLSAALSDLVAPLKAAGIAVTLDVPEDAHLINDIEALFYRVAQEAIRNSRTHGDASEVRIALVQGSDETLMLIEDNGRGFLRSEIAEGGPEGHFGLRLVRDLVDHAGGRLEIESAPGRGTLIAVVMPSP